jgi:acyl-CoA synthetase (AMP-forming)/AMP-acid ligase II
MVIVMFGILKAGAAYIPIDRKNTNHLEESKIKHVLVYESTREELITYCQSICLTVV